MALIEHWNGTQWSVVSSPSPDNDAFLNGVTAVSSTNVWAVGYYFTSGSSQSGGGSQTLIEQWNGSQWSVIASPNSASQYNDLTGIAAVSANNIWVVGNSNNGSQTLIEQWNGSQWSIVASPNPGSSSNSLNAVATISASDVWAVGSFSNSSGVQQTLIEQWNGSKWSIITSSNPGSVSNLLNAVAVVSASNVWAVGEYSSTNYASQSLVENSNGSTWSVVPSPNVVTHPTASN
jgi:hypothetical protein